MSDLVGNPEDRFSRVAAHMGLSGNSIIECSCHENYGFGNLDLSLPAVSQGIVCIICHFRPEKIKF